MSDPKAHLLRQADRHSHGDLSGPTGLSRLTLTEQVVTAGERLTLPSGREQFLYVLTGDGELLSTDQRTGPDDQGSATAELHSGDFVALTASEEAVIRAESASLKLLIGRGPATTPP